MKIQRFITSLVALAAIICSCQTEQDTQTLPSNAKTDIEFTLSITDLSYDSAQVSVKHNGTTNDTWYGFLTEDTEKLYIKKKMYLPDYVDENTVYCSVSDENIARRQFLCHL